MFIYLEVFPGIGLAVDGKNGKCEEELHFLFDTFLLTLRQYFHEKKYEKANLPENWKEE
jgi:hypothetical protein